MTAVKSLGPCTHMVLGETDRSNCNQNKAKQVFSLTTRQVQYKSEISQSNIELDPNSPLKLVRFHVVYLQFIRPTSKVPNPMGNT